MGIIRLIILRWWYGTFHKSRFIHLQFAEEWFEPGDIVADRMVDNSKLKYYGENCWLVLRDKK